MKEPSGSEYLVKLKERMQELLPRPAMLRGTTAVKGLNISRVDEGGRTINCFYDPGVAFIIQGRKHAMIGSCEYEYGAGESMVSSVDLPSAYEILDTSPEHPFLSLSVAFDPAIVNEVILSLDPKDDYAEKDRGVEVQGASFSTLTEEIAEVLLKMLNLADKPQDAAFLTPMLHRVLYFYLLKGPHGVHMRKLFTQGSQGNQIAKAINWLRNNFQHPLDVDTLAESVFMAPSTFYKNFKKITTLSPLQFHKRLRLYEAKRLMLSERFSAAQACYAVGYESQQQFTREYKRLFGKPPMQDIKDGAGRLAHAAM